VVGRGALLIEGGLFRAVDEAFQNDGAIADAGQRTGGDGEVVAYEVEFGDLGFAGKIELIDYGVRGSPSRKRAAAPCREHFSRDMIGGS
jgi:hypothetical protein